MPDPSYHAPSALEAAQAAQASAEDIADALTISEQRYRRLFEASRDGILLLDSDRGRITDANPFMTELVGYSHAELLGKQLWEIGLLQDKEANQDAFLQLRQEDYIRYEDLPLRTRTSEERQVEFVSNLYRENGHRVIQCNIRDITDRKRVEAELVLAALKNERIAETLQRSMLQAVPTGKFPGIDVETFYAAASNEAEVGGDFFDAFALKGDRVALVVGDVSGKGLIAAGRTAEVKYALRAFLHEAPSPSIALSHLNDFICETHRLDSSIQEAFIVLAVAVLNSTTGEAAFSAAGAEPSLILRNSGVAERMEISGMPLGIYPDAAYTDIITPLEAGETVLLATDGITEARHEFSFLGIDGMATLAETARPSASLSELSRSIYEGALEFADGTFRDDVCLLLARRQ